MRPELLGPAVTRLQTRNAAFEKFLRRVYLRRCALCMLAFNEDMHDPGSDLLCPFLDDEVVVNPETDLDFLHRDCPVEAMLKDVE